MSDFKKGFNVGDPIPKAMGRVADLYHDVKEVRLAMDKEVAKVKARERELEQHMIDNISTSDDTGAIGLHYQCRIKPQKEPTVTDWGPVYDYIVKNDRFDLLQKRLGTGAVKEIIESGERIPGISMINVKKLSVTKIQ